MNKDREEVLKKLADEVYEDFLRRQKERRLTERNWQLNLNFVNGEQYCGINGKGELYKEDSTYYWQTKRVFNHISAMVELRCAKIGRVRPALVVRAASEDESDKNSASLASSILSAVCEDCDVDSVLTDATVWSETCGTAFYKIVWDGTSGKAVGITGDGKKVKEGDVRVYAVSPFEIYPYSLSEEHMEAQPSIIHAKVVPVQDIYSAYGVKLAGKDIDEFNLSPYYSSGKAKGDNDSGEVRHGYELLIERYERPTEDNPLGKLTVVAGGKVLHEGVLPYVNGENGERTYPFVRQVALPVAGSFFGTCTVDRLIPVQRAYNAVKNRKHEFLNRISMGTVAVEDGSVDTDELIEDGLTPGKVIVYRQGSKPPEMLTLGSVPSGFESEEENLLNEFSKVSGTGEITDNVSGFSGITSATGLQLIIEQDESRMDFAYRQIKRALKLIGRHILRLYRQFATDIRLLKYAGKDNVLKLYYFKGSDISSDDVVLEADNELNLSPAQRRAVICELLDRGLFSDSEGKLSQTVKNKVLEMMGYKLITGERDLTELHKTRAGEENIALRAEYVGVNFFDDHKTHVTEHTAFLLSETLSEKARENICAHIKEHKTKIN